MDIHGQSNQGTVSVSLYLDIQKTTQFKKSRIASLCKIPLSTFYRLTAGITKNPRHETFSKLLGIYCAICQLNNFSQSHIGGEVC